MKKCFKCNTVKSLDEFYPHKKMKDGHLNKCKECSKSDTKKNTDSKSNDLTWILNERERQRVKAEKQRQEGKASIPRRETNREWRIRNRIKQAAHNAVARAISSGDLTAELCHCGRKAEAHHEDYTKPLDVVWLCSKHHGLRHREIRELEIKRRLSCPA